MNDLDGNRIIGGIVVGLAELALEEIKNRIKKRKNPKWRKRRKNILKQ